MDNKIQYIIELKDQLSAKLGMANKSVSGFQNSVNGLKQSLMGLMPMLTAGGLVMGFRKIVTSAADFEKSVSNLSAITGATGQDLDSLRQSSLDLSLTSTQSAAGIVEAYKFIASAKPELLTNIPALKSITKEVLILADAASMAMPEAALNLTDAMNQFSAPAQDAARFVNVLAAGAKFGAAEIPQITDALLKFGVAAKASNVSIEESTAVIETLAEKGMKAEIAGTALRAVFAKMSATGALPKDAIKNLAQFGVNTKLVSDKTVPFVDRLREMAKVVNDETALVNIFGLENKEAARILLGNVGRFQELTNQVTGTNTAYEQAATNTNNLATTFDKIGNAAATLGINIGTNLNTNIGGLSNALLDSIKYLSAHGETIANIIVTVVKAGAIFAGWKIAIFAITSATKLASAATIAYKLATAALSGGMKAAIITSKALKAAMASTGVGLLVVGIGLVIEKIMSLTDKTDELKQSMSDATGEVFAQQAALSDLFNIAKDLTRPYEMRKKAIDEINKSYGQYLTNQLSEKSTLQDIESAQRAATAAMVADLAAKAQSEEIQTAFTTYLTRQKKIIEDIRSQVAGQKGEFISGQAVKDIQDVVTNYRRQNTEYIDMVNQLELPQIEKIKSMYTGKKGEPGQAPTGNELANAYQIANRYFKDGNEHILEVFQYMRKLEGAKFDFTAQSEKIANFFNGSFGGIIPTGLPTPLQTNQTNAGGLPTPGKIVTPTGNLESGLTGVEARAPKTFNININNLVDKFTIETTNIKDGATQVKALMTETLMNALNETQIIAGA